MLPVYDWSDTSSPIRDMFVAMNCQLDEHVSVSYFNESGVWNTRHTKLKYADSFAQMLEEDSSNVYVMVNEVSAGPAVGRGDVSQITRVRALWADLDFKDSGLQDEMAASQVIDLLSGMLNASPTFVVFSGYGLQPYWVLDDANVTDNNRAYMKSLIKRWGQLVQRVASIEGGYVDPVYDLPRVLRAPGTFNHKVKDSPVATRISFLDGSSPLTVDQVEEVLVAYGFVHEETPVDEFVVVSNPDTWEPAEHDCAWALAVVDEISQGDPPARHPWMVGKATKIEAAARFGCVTEATYEQLVLLLRDKFEALLSNGDNARPTTHNEVASTLRWARVLVASMDEIRLAQAVDYHTHRLGVLGSVPNLPKESPSDVNTSLPGDASLGALAQTQTIVAQIAIQEQSFAFTDSANASRLAANISGRFLFVPNIGWHKWENHRWVLDETKQILQEAIDSAYRFAETNPSETTIKWVKRSLQNGALKSAIEIAETTRDLVCQARFLDSVPLELCTPDGVINLAKNELREGDPYKDRHTKQTRVSPQKIPVPKWEEFLRDVIVDDERIHYIQELFGLALIGETLHHVLPLLVGTGANGKSTILEVASGLLGDYVTQMPENFLLDKGFQEHSTEIARLRGVRLAIGSETRPDGKFNESRVKMLTGGDTISARLIGKNFFDFKPSHTLILAMNHLPKVSAGGDGFWRRVRKINFDVTIPPEKQNKHLAQMLIDEEGPGILQWMLQGAQRVYESGSLNEPESVRMATQEYQLEEDNIAQYVTDRTFVNAHMSYSAQEIYNNYKMWCQQESETPISRTQLLRELTHRLPLVKEKGRRGVRYTGVGLYEE
jgi:P4 family phage/plasmid primase-like protien